jgi:Protein of unknown function (DUF1097)
MNLVARLALVTRLALVIGLLGAFATWLFLGPLAGLSLQIWAAFVIWGAFYHCGGGIPGLKAALAGGIWGAIMAAVALVLIAKVGGGAVGAAICVGITVATFILGANVPLLAVIPAAVYGYSAVAALALLKPGEDIFSVDIVSNPFINIMVSMVIGSIFAFVSEKIVRMLGAQSGAPVEA